MCFYCGTETFDDWEHDAYGQNKSYGQPLTNQLGSILDFANYTKEGFWNDFGYISGEWNLSSNGYRAENGQLDYYFGPSSNDVSGLNLTYQLQATESFRYLESVLGIKFREYDGGDIDIYFTDNDTGAYESNSVYPLGGFKLLSVINVSTNWSQNDYLYQTFMHEIGHALGLGHTGNYNSPAVITEAKFLNDGWPMSIMSYWDTYDNDYLSNSFGYVRTLMPADFLALDMIYNDYGFGTTNAFIGDTIYGFDTNISSNSSYFLNQMNSDLLNDTYYCIADGAGEDTLNFSGFSNDQLIDLRPSVASNTSATTMNIAGKIGNVSLAVGTIIENAVGGSGDDVIYGNAHDNDITSGNGNDEIYALGGTNTINAGDGGDTIYLCNDYSGSSISFSFSGDAIYDTIDGGAGTDIFNLSACVGYDTLHSWRDFATVDGSGSDFSLELLNSNFTFSIANVETIQGFYSGTISSDDFVYWLLPNNVASGSVDISSLETIASVEFDGTDHSHGMSVYTSSSENYFIADATNETGASMLEAGARLTTSNDIYDEDGVNNYSYQWYKNGSIIRGENSSIYTLQSGDDGDAFTVAVNFTDDRYFDESVISSALTVDYSSQTTIMDSKGKNSWMPKALEITALLEDGSGYKLILHDVAKDSYSSLSVTSSGKTGKKASSLSNVELLSLETTLGSDLNGDGALGDAVSAVSYDGSDTDLALSVYALSSGGYQIGMAGFEVSDAVTGSTVSLMDSKGKNSWTPKALEITALLEDGSGYELILHDVAKDSYSSLSVTSSGKTGKKASSLSNAELLSLETTLGNDLNGDGVVGKAVAPSDALAQLNINYIDERVFDQYTSSLETVDAQFKELDKSVSTHLNNFKSYVDLYQDNASLTVSSKGFTIDYGDYELAAYFATFSPNSLSELQQLQNIDAQDSSTWIIDGGFSDIVIKNTSGDLVKLVLDTAGLSLTSETVSSGDLSGIRLDGTFSNQVSDLLTIADYYSKIDSTSGNTAASHIDDLRAFANGKFELTGISLLREGATDVAASVSYANDTLSFSIEKFELSATVQNLSDVVEFTSSELLDSNQVIDLFDDISGDETNASLILKNTDHGRLLNLQIEDLNKLENVSIGSFNTFGMLDGNHYAVDENFILATYFDFGDKVLDTSAFTSYFNSIDDLSDVYIEIM
ncbi:M10 family metallopeptidase C-terminal domain-containing protein [Rhodobacteraceae bacterium]|nr:M10 family metallopeptidase C-terminal domain-containing protein [Paracoccaceae bacterium]